MYSYDKTADEYLTVKVTLYKINGDQTEEENSFKTTEYCNGTHGIRAGDVFINLIIKSASEDTIY